MDKRDLQAGSLAMSSPQESGAFKVKIDVKELEKDWDVTEDPELQKVLNVAKLLGRTAPPKMNNVRKVPMFDLLPTAIRKLTNPRATVKSVMASLQRNLAGFNGGGGETRRRIGEFFTRRKYFRNSRNSEAPAGEHHEEGDGGGLHAGGADR